MNLEDMMSDLISGIDIKPFGPLRKGKHVIALPTAYETKRRIHGCTKNVMMISYEWKKGAKMPNHEHDVEQISYVVEGKFKVTIGGESFIAEKGDSYTEPSRSGHSLEALEDGVTIEVFSPPRPHFLILEAAASHDVHGAFEDLKKKVKASKKSK